MLLLTLRETYALRTLQFAKPNTKRQQIWLPTRATKHLI